MTTRETKSSKTNKTSDTSAKKKTTTRKRKSAAQRREEAMRVQAEREKQAEIMQSVGWIVFFGVSLFWMIINCNFIKTNFAAAIRGFSFGIFGALAYVMPLAIFLLSLFVHLNRGIRSLPWKFGSLIALILSVGISLALFAGNVITSANGNVKFGEAVTDIWSTAKECFNGGGIIFGIPAYLLCKLVGVLGTALILAILAIVAIIFLTEGSIVKVVKKGGKKIAETTGETTERIAESSMSLRERLEESNRRRHEENEERRRRQKEEAERLKIERAAEKELEEQRKEEETILRREHKVTGVMLDPRVSEKEITPVGVADTDSPVPVTASEASGVKPEETEIPVIPIHRHSLDDLHEINVVTTNTVPIALPEGTEYEFKAPSEPERIVTEPVKKTEEVKTEPEKRKEIPPVDMADIPTPITERNNKDVPREGERPGFAESEPTKSSTPAPSVKAPVRRNAKYEFPSVKLLIENVDNGQSDSEEELKLSAATIRDTLKNFGVNVSITGISQGPSITRYEIQPEMGIPVSKIVKYENDIKMNLAATDIRIEAPIPGKPAVGIEVPNKNKKMVRIRDLIAPKDFAEQKSKISFTVGKDLAGKLIYGDIATMPHMLIAGATGSGKSVCINSIIISILYKADPSEVKLILIDPKVVELSIYNGIPHLLLPVVTNPKLASNALKWAVNEMTRRYRIFADSNVRDMKGFNQMVGNGEVEFEGEMVGKLPQIVIVVDELADLMTVAAKEVEESINRLAALARAAGIHLILATQRPSVDVITGVIKNNMPSRIAFSVTSGVDSRTILDCVGAEKLLGKGDMLYYPQGYSKPVRIQGVFVADEEVEKVTSFIKAQNISGGTESIESAIKNFGGGGSSQSIGGGNDSDDDGVDELFADAGRYLIRKEKASIGMLQRNFKIGFNRAARIVDQLAEAGVVGPEEGTKPRQILMTIEEFEEYLS